MERKTGGYFTIGLFVSTLLWFRRKKQFSCDNEALEGTPDLVSSRGAAALQKGSSYWESFIMCLKDPCDPRMNPEGYIALCTAENKLIQETLACRLMQMGTAVTAFSDSSSFCHASSLGLYNARVSMAYFLQKRFLHRMNTAKVIHRVESRTAPLESLDQSISGSRHYDDIELEMNPENISFGAGVNSLLSQLLYIIASPGEAVLIPAPYYATYEYDIKTLPECVIVPVYMDNPLIGPTPKDLQNSFEIAEKQGYSVRALLMTNPNDPLGVIYNPEILKNAVAWARSKKMHTIMNEIYALSVRANGPSDDFHSIIKVFDNDLSTDIHFLYSLSKDFGAAGFRFGIIYTQNQKVLHALANLNIFAGVSNPIQMIMSDLLLDDEFVDSFLEESRLKLWQSYNICRQKLEEMVIPYVISNAGLFIYVDFSSLLPEQTFEGEAKLAALIESVGRIVMTPGASQRDCKPGMFRLCYAWVSPALLEIAMERLSYIVLQIRRHEWGDLLLGNWTNEVTKCGTHLSSRRSTQNFSDLIRQEM